jgi:hypothetical protein
MKTINIEIAEGPSMLAQGLMYRERLDISSGMLFKFPDITYASFWGKNTYIPLDIAFISNDGEVVDINNIVPMSTRTIHSSGPCKYALEVNAGVLKENDIGVGTKIEIDEKNKKINWRKENA